MAEALSLLTVPQAIEAAAALRQRIDTAIDARRAITGTSTAAIASMAVLIGQLDAIARAAAEVDLDRHNLHDPEDAFRAAYVAGLLRIAGYLSFPETTAQEPTHGEG